ncbi:MAG: hypothetical protein O7G85_08480 [Planctomycetota bacterium]|nr:hypothetical protein [Planctomycetota bacterium]
MSSNLWHIMIAASMIVLGAGIGLYAGRLLHLLFIERVKIISRFMGVIGFLLGGGAGSVVLDFLLASGLPEGAAIGAYALGLGLALIAAWVIDTFIFKVTDHVWRETAVTPNRVREILRLNDLLTAAQPNAKLRAKILTALLIEPDFLSRDARADLGKGLPDALDTMASAPDPPASPTIPLPPS